MVGDGELQEGSVWEAIMYAGQNHLDNLCVLVDRNNGQLDVHNRMLFPMPSLDQVFQSFGWVTYNVDATQYDGVFAVLESFRSGPRNGHPTAIICNTTKDYGAFSDFMNKHKVTTSEALIVQERALQEEQRSSRVDEFLHYIDELDRSAHGDSIRGLLLDAARQMHLEVDESTARRHVIRAVVGPVLTKRVPPRDKTIGYDPALLPKLDAKKSNAAAEIVTAAMKVFARDSSVVSIDSDLASTSGLEAGIAAVDQRRP
jgi:transketolase